MIDPGEVEQRVRRERLKEVLLGRRESPVYLGRFELRELLGAGGMGSVYAARDPDLDRTVAIKLLHEALPAEYLREEARTLARLSHPNVVHVHEIGSHDGRAFVVMERVVGQSLAQWLDHSPRRWRTVLRAFVAAGRGLAAAHALGIVHRDFKPDNVLIDDTDHVRVADFGLAFLSDASSTTPPQGAGITGVAGTPQFMAPEVGEGRSADAKSDQYSFCVSVFEALFGEHASVSDSPARRVRHALMRGRADDPDARWPSMEALLARLEKSVSRVVGWQTWVALGAVAVTTAAVGSQRQQDDPCERGAQALAQAWPDSTRVQVASHEPGDGAPSIAAGLDAYAERWSNTYDSVCRAQTGAHAEVCLHSRLRVFSGVAAGLAEHELPAGRQLAAVLSLPSVEDCALRVETPHESLDLDIELAVADATAAAVVSISAETLVDFEAITQRAREGGHRLSLTHALLEHGILLMSLGEQPDAAPRFEEAYWVALEDGYDTEASRAATWLAFVHGVSLREHALGAQWARLAETTARRPSVPASVHADALVKRALILKEAGEFSEAITMFDGALEVLSTVASPSPLAVVEYADRRSVTLIEVGRAEESLPGLVDAIEYARVTFGQYHPNVAHLLSTYGLALEALDRNEEAVETFRDALEIYEIRHNREGRASARLQLAEVLHAVGRSAEGLPLAQESLRQKREIYGDQSPYVGSCRAVLAKLLLDLDRSDRAQEEIESAVSLLETHLGPEHPDLVEVLLVQARVYEHKGWRDEAGAVLGRVAAIAAELPEARRKTIQEQLAQIRQAMEASP